MGLAPTVGLRGRDLDAWALASAGFFLPALGDQQQQHVLLLACRRKLCRGLKSYCSAELFQ